MLLQFEKQLILLNLVLKQLPNFSLVFSYEEEKINDISSESDRMNGSKKTLPLQHEIYCLEDSRYDFLNGNYLVDKNLGQERFNEEDNCNTTTYNSIESSKCYTKVEKKSCEKIVREKWFDGDYDDNEEDKDSIKEPDVVKLRPKSQIQVISYILTYHVNLMIK